MSVPALPAGVAVLDLSKPTESALTPNGWPEMTDALISRLRRARAAGVGAVLAPPSAPFFAALHALAPDERPELLALVPNFIEYVRDSSETGLMGAAVKRLRRANPTIITRLLCHGVAHARQILARDFGALLTVLLELELAGFRRFRPSHVVLAAPLTDLALAAGNQSFFRFYARYIQTRHRARPCLETMNGGYLLARLRKWGVGIDSVVTALNSKGFRMKPTLEVSLTEMAQATSRILAREVTAGGTVSLVSGVAFALSHGARGVLVDLDSTETSLQSGTANQCS